jgi:single-strand DNA-binding protein
MEGLNRVLLVGTVEGVPRHRRVSTGRGKLWMRVHTVSESVEEDGVRRARPGWHNVVLWGPPADALADRVRAGTKVSVDGALRHRSYLDRRARGGGSPEVVAESVRVMAAPGD